MLFKKVFYNPKDQEKHQRIFNFHNIVIIEKGYCTLHCDYSVQTPVQPAHSPMPGFLEPVLLGRGWGRGWGRVLGSGVG